MDADFWRRKWRDDELGWHRPAPNPMLVENLPFLGLTPGARVFAPLCGKTLDIGWLLESGLRVAGAELVESAIEQLFEGLAVAPAVDCVGELKRYRGERIEVFVGDLFALDSATFGPVDGTYDRAALVALPAETRRRYAAHVETITAGARQLLVTFDYDPARMDGPPFSVTEDEVRALYGGRYAVELLASAEVEGGLKGFCPATERAWRLTPRAA